MLMDLKLTFTFDLIIMNFKFVAYKEVINF
jgi:hypothetical protein